MSEGKPVSPAVLRYWRTVRPERLALALRELAAAVRRGEAIPTAEELTAIAEIIVHCESEMANRGFRALIDALGARPEAPPS